MGRREAGMLDVCLGWSSNPVFCRESQLRASQIDNFERLMYATLHNEELNSQLEDGILHLDGNLNRSTSAHRLQCIRFAV